MNQRDWIRLLTPKEKDVLGFALADQDRILDREGEVRYYANTKYNTTEAMVEMEQLRQSIIEEL